MPDNNNDRTKEIQEKPDPYKKYKDFKWEDPDLLKKGPVDDSHRSCRDIICCLFFVAFLVGMVIVTILGFSQGDPNMVLYPYDEDGNQCGRGGTSQYPYLYLYKAVSNLKDYNVTKIAQGICVSSCPVEYSETLPCFTTSKNPDCSISKVDFYPSTSFIDRFCIPRTNNEQATNSSEIIFINGTAYAPVRNETSSNSATSLINLSAINTDKLIAWISDLTLTWPIILSSLGWCFVIAIIFMVFTRYCAGVITYITIILILAAFCGLGYLFQQRKDYYKSLNDETYETTMLVLCIICYTLAGIWFLVVIFMCNRIRLAIAITKVTGQYLSNTWSVFSVPIIFFILTGCFFAYWVALSIYLYSTGSVVKGNTFVANIEWTSTTRYAWWYHLFALFYITAFISAYNQFVLASSACIWYFEHKLPDGAERPVSRSFFRGGRYHLGSIAFGALIVAIIRFMVAVLEYIKQKVESTTNTKSKIYKCVISCCQCCLLCFARIMEFINKHAYIQIALKGDSFCVSAWEGFGLIIRNLGRFSMLFLIGGFFTIFGVLFIASSSGVIGYLLITRIPQFADKLTSPVLPVFVMIMIGIIIGMISMSIFGMSGDALMHSFLLDEELNDRNPQNSPDELQSFINEER